MHLAIFGDSILADNTPISTDLQKFAPSVRIQNFAKIGAGMKDGWIESIPSIYAGNSKPVPSTVLLDGGGNDVNSVRQDCMEMTQACTETIDTVVDLVQDLMQRMNEDGVGDIVYVGFFYIKGFEAADDYGNDHVKSVCRSQKRCHFVDLRSTNVEVGWDGMHPVESSYHDISRKIWGTIVQYNISFV
jgi:hypothetical protein